ncbi:MAG: DUF6514 family protein [Defluviitaleaceae bacterium]|nr:DUF6514 family protein [Defluviitaleaceae bacterium]
MHNISKISIQSDAGEVWTLEYFLDISQSEEGQEVYGLRIDQRTPDDVLINSEASPPLTKNRDAALALAEDFAKYSVFPNCLLETIDDNYDVYESSLLST